MERISIIFLHVVIVLIGIGAIVFMLWEPHIEGRNANATLFEIYFKDPFLAGAYIASIPFFVALYQALKVLRYVGQDKAFSKEAILAMKSIRYCALAIIGFVLLGEIVIIMNQSDDRAGGIFIGAIIAFASTVVVAAVAILERIFQSGLDLRSGNDLLVNTMMEGS